MSAPGPAICSTGQLHFSQVEPHHEKKTQSKITASTNLHIKFSMHVVCRYIFDDIHHIHTYLRVFWGVGYHPESVPVPLARPNWRFRWIMTRFSSPNSFTNTAQAAVMCNEAPSNCCCCKIKSSFCCNPRWCRASRSHNHWCQAFCVVCSGGSHSFSSIDQNFD